MHSLNYAPGSFGGGRREGERSALQPLWQGQQCLGPQDLLPRPEDLEVLTGAQPLLDSSENLQEPPEEKWRPGTWLWVAMASGKPCIY